VLNLCSRIDHGRRRALPFWISPARIMPGETSWAFTAQTALSARETPGQDVDTSSEWKLSLTVLRSHCGPAAVPSWLRARQAGGMMGAMNDGYGDIGDLPAPDELGPL
jgi:hypothetical protein